MITGLNGDLAAAHLVPLNISKKIASSLALENELNNVRNILILNHGIEQAYDKQRISFIPGNPLSNNDFVLKIWDDSVRNEPISKNSKVLIGEYEHASLKLTFPGGKVHFPFKRALSYHNFLTFMKWSLHNNEIHNNEEPVDFSSDHGGNWNKDRLYWMNDLRKKIHRETADESDDGSEKFSGNSSNGSETTNEIFDE
jgi:hypothetical protein